MMVEKSTAEGKLWKVCGAQFKYPNQLHVACKEQQALDTLRLSRRWKQVEGDEKYVYIY